MGVDGETILATLCSMHDNARASGARTVCLAVPPFALEKVRSTVLYFVSFSNNSFVTTKDQEYFSLHSNKMKVNSGLRYMCMCDSVVDTAFA